MDMAGNVWEWCLNKYDMPSDTEIDESAAWRVVRGGSWYDPQFNARAASCHSDYPSVRSNDYGFRVVVRRPPSHLDR